MIEQGRAMCENNVLSVKFHYSVANAELLPFPDNYFSGITIAFGLRNITIKSRALKEMARVLQTGGRLIILEFSKRLFLG